jgi:glutamyl-tRNA reductase
MGFFILGVNHKECPVAIREKLHFANKLLETALGEAKSFAAISELVILSTCNRVEFYGFTEEGQMPQAFLVEFLAKLKVVEPNEFAPYLYRYEGQEAMRHLFRVASGLDSLVLGENEILGQLREAFRMANQIGTCHSLLYRLMEKALKTGKEVRSKTKINEGAVSVPSVAVELAEKIFGRLAGEKVMVLGTGEMSELTLKSLRNAGARIMVIVSRNEERGTKLAREFEAEWSSLEGWTNYLASVDIMIASTAAPHPIVHFGQVQEVMKRRRNRPLFLIDIAVPRDVEPEINAIDDVYLYNIDDLKGVAAANLRLRRHEIQAAEEIVEQAMTVFQSWLEQLEARPTLERFENFLNEILDRELKSLAENTGVSESQKNEVRDRLRAKLLHPPLEKIKQASQNGGVTRYLEALRSLFDLDENSKS